MVLNIPSEGVEIVLHNCPRVVRNFAKLSFKCFSCVIAYDYDNRCIVLLNPLLSLLRTVKGETRITYAPSFRYIVGGTDKGIVYTRSPMSC